jgi:hypothetical protein
VAIYIASATTTFQNSHVSDPVPKSKLPLNYETIYFTSSWFCQQEVPCCVRSILSWVALNLLEPLLEHRHMECANKHADDGNTSRNAPAKKKTKKKLAAKPV